ncbi:MAG: FecR domain-containing protein [Bacteroidales bacterium]|nr:FecR domain-containing protein [Bacteroidales bacterium]
MTDGYLKKLWDNVPEEGDPGTGDRIWNSICNIIRCQERRREKRRNLSLAAISSVAVAASLLAGVFLGMHLGQENYIDHKLEYIIAAESGAYVLPDGSTVWMEHGGRLRFPEEFGGEREVWLEGNASFEVVHEQDCNPFLLHLADADIRVLGTGFTVRQDSCEISLALHHGCVEFIAPASGTVRLEPQQGIVYDTQTGEYSFNRFFSGITWHYGCYRIENADLKGLLRFIEWQYGTKVSICDIKDGSQKFNGTVSCDEPLDAVLDKLCYVLKINCEKDGSGYRLYRQAD